MTQLITTTASKQCILWESQPALADIRKIYGKGLCDAEFTTFMQIGKATKLNPFLREIWCVKYGSEPASIFIGRDGYRKSAQANHEYDYHLVDAVYSNDEFGLNDGAVLHRYKLNDRGMLVGAYCVVKRKSAEKIMFAYVELKEYTTGKALWVKKPATMIKKVAEAQALRMAFQELFAGTYHEYEDWHDTTTTAQPTVIHKPKGVEALKKHLGIQKLPTVDDIIEKIKDSQTIAELKANVKLASHLPESEKVLLRGLYRKKHTTFTTLTTNTNNKRSTTHVTL